MRGSTVAHFGFNTETSPGPAHSLARQPSQVSAPMPKSGRQAITGTLHNGGGGFTTLKVFDQAMEAVYAKPQSRG